MFKVIRVDSKGEYNAVPTLYAAFTCNNVGYIIMNKMNKCFHAFLSHIDTETENKKMYAMLCCVYSIQQKLILYGWLHVDTHVGNIVCNKIRAEPILIDFGWAVYNPDYDTRNPDATYSDFNKLYPEHPLCKPSFYNTTLSWHFLDLIQLKNLVENYKMLVGKYIEPKLYNRIFEYVIIEHRNLL